MLREMGSYPIAAIQNRARAMRDAGEPLIDFSNAHPRDPPPSFIPEALRRPVPDVTQ